MAEPEIVERSRSHFLMRDDDGFSLWGADQDGDDPLLTFAPDAAGEERARSAFRMRSKETARVRRLGVGAVIAGIAHLAANAGQLVLQLVPLQRGPDFAFVDPFSDPGRYELQVILSAVSGFTYALLLVSVGWLVVVWLQRRWRREG